MTNDLAVTLRAVLARIAPEADLDAVDDHENLREALDIDSIDFLNFVIGIHETLGVEVPEADYPHLATIADAVAYLAPRVTSP